ncbi:MAG: hypothetical protein ABIO02_03080 [Patescibacteria group bacterium]
MKLPKELTTVTTLSKTLAMVAFIILPFIAFFAGVRYQEAVNRTLPRETFSYPAPVSPTIVPSPSLSTSKPEVTPVIKPPFIKKSVSISNVTYKLPSGWDGEITQENTLLLTANSGGFFNITAFQYDGFTSRREYYCKLVEYCLASTQFTGKQIGNISGYSASPLDNSGGGTEYFGVKGSTFYIISTFSPSGSSENEFDKHRSEVLSSIVF